MGQPRLGGVGEIRGATAGSLPVDTADFSPFSPLARLRRARNDKSLIEDDDVAGS
jgi:hypothetical protein